MSIFYLDNAISYAYLNESLAGDAPTLEEEVLDYVIYSRFLIRLSRYAY